MKINKLFLVMIFSVYLQGQDIFVGVVKPLHDIKLSLSTDGIVNKIFVKEGALVKKGDTLIILDNTLQELETQRRKLIWKDNSRLNSTLSENKILASLLSSTKKLYESVGGVSKAEMQSLEIKYQTSLGEYKYLKESKKKEEIEYQIAKKLLDQFSLYSPIEGVVTKVNIDLGEFVKNTEPIIHIVDSTNCFVEMNINKESISLLNKDQNLTITSEFGSNKISKKAKIIFISPIADRSSGLFFVKAEFSNKNLDILPGLAVSVRLEK